jgi:hypothetical protein
MTTALSEPETYHKNNRVNIQLQVPVRSPFRISSTEEPRGGTNDDDQHDNRREKFNSPFAAASAIAEHLQESQERLPVETKGTNNE